MARVQNAGQFQSICCTTFMVNLYQGCQKWQWKCPKVTTREQMRSICWTNLLLASWVNLNQGSRKWHLKCPKVTTRATKEQNEDNMEPDFLRVNWYLFDRNWVSNSSKVHTFVRKWKSSQNNFIINYIFSMTLQRS
jgi:hypothetical protein